MCQNNYEKWCQEWQTRFLTMDQKELLHKLPELKEIWNSQRDRRDYLSKRPKTTDTFLQTKYLYTPLVL